MSTIATAQKPPAIKKVSLFGIKTGPAAKTKTEYPVLPDTSGDVALLVGDIIAETEQLDALTGSLDAKKGELRRIAADHYFALLSGKSDIPSSISCLDSEGREVLVAFQNRYKILPDESGLAETIGEERVAKFFRQKFELKVDGDKLPAEKAQDIIEGMQELFRIHGCDSALTAKANIAPTADFHIGRHTAFTVEENMSLDRIVPIIAMCKTKGRKAA
jgi:hypothetical protein